MISGWFRRHLSGVPATITWGEHWKHFSRTAPSSPTTAPATRPWSLRRRVLRPEDLRPARQPGQPVHRLHLDRRGRGVSGTASVLTRPRGRRLAAVIAAFRLRRRHSSSGFVGGRARAARRGARRADGRARGLWAPYVIPGSRGCPGPAAGRRAGAAGAGGAVRFWMTTSSAPAAILPVEISPMWRGPAGAAHTLLYDLPSGPGSRGRTCDDRRAGARAGRRDARLVPPHGQATARDPRRAADLLDGQATAPRPRCRAGCCGFLLVLVS